MDLIEKIEREEVVREMVYTGNLSFEEMITFYQQASDAQIKRLERLLKSGKMKGAKKLIELVLGIKFK